MKHKIQLLFIALGLLVSTYGRGQAPSDGPGNPIQELRESLGTLNPSRIPTGVLLDRMVLMSNPHRFAGQGDTAATYPGFEQQYWEFYNAALNASALPTLEALRSSIGQRVQQGAVPLLMLSYDYNELLPTAATEGLITVDSTYGRVYDGPDFSRSPYRTGSLFSVALPVPATATTMNVYVGPEFWLSNRFNPGYMWLDFGDGQGWRQVTMGSTVQVQVMAPAPAGQADRGTSGAITQTVYAFEPSNGYTSKTTLAYLRAASTPPDVALGLLGQPWPGFQPTKGVNGPNGRPSGIGWIKYADGNSTGKLRRPLVFVEGIDFPEYRNDVFLIRNRYIDQTGPIPLSDFFAGINELGGYRNGTAGWNEMVDYNDEYKSLEKFKDLRGQLQASVTQAFPDGTRGGGYDVIYLDFSDGASLIQHNAMVLVELLQWINKPENRENGAEETMVVAVSMGGQVARFALAWMEQQNLCHNSKLYVSFDSPHRGANVPVGIQHMFNRLQNIAVGAGSAQDVIQNQVRREASMQMINFHYSSDAAPLRNAWQAWQQSPNSYPSLLRKVAVANGSGQAVSQSGMVPGMELLKTQYAAIGWSALVAGPNHAYALPGISTRGKNNVVFRYKRAFFSSVNNWRYSYADPAWGHFDTSPGSTTRVAEEADKQSGPLKAAHPSNTFMPTLSALDVRDAGSYNSPNFGYNIRQQIPQEDRPNRAKYAFDAYFVAGNVNEPHVQITNGQASQSGNDSYFTNNGAWIQNELRESAHNVPADLSGVYNFGSPYRHLLPSVRINYAAQLLVNDVTLPASGGTPATQGRPAGGNFELYTSNCPTVVRVNDVGLLRLGMAGATPNTATLRMAANSLLDVEHSGQIEVNPGSVLRIAAGATLVLRRNARLIIQGQVIVEAGAYLCVEDQASIIRQGAGTYTVDPATNYFANPALNLGTLACGPSPAPALSVNINSLTYRNWCTSSTGRNNYAEFTAAATGGTGGYRYDWYVDATRTGNSYQLVGSGNPFGICMNTYSSLVLVRVRATSGAQTATADYYAQPQRIQAVYPNPANDYVEIGSEEEAPDEPSGLVSQSAAKAGSQAAPLAKKEQKPLHITVHNGQGKEVFKAGNIKTATLRVNTQAWPAGLYQVTVQRDKTITRRQLSVQH